ncbi:MAG: pirin family protein [Mucilaginibacter sp.]|uniref:pirin family protein n=1 Tax=Mucilaginibacter sp. TaxID=1882438 RepID=UPI0034E463E2
MANTIFHKAESRGHANHGWLDSYHSFSFANYYSPERMNFGALRVLNDDTVSGGRGFGSHPHDNMEIISIPLEGDLEHEDNLGNVAVIKKGDVQIISAGTGVFHSEKNKNPNQQVQFLQIWLYPNKLNGAPRYDQVSLDVKDRHNNFQQILSPNPDDEGVWVQQDAWFSLGKFDEGFQTKYQIKKPGNGVYAFVLEGDVMINGQALHRRDGLGIWDTDQLSFKADSADAEVLLMDVPMEF